MKTKNVCTSAMKIVVTNDIEEEKRVKTQLLSEGIYAAGVNFGGNFIDGIPKIIERVIVAAKREGILTDTSEEGAIIGATKEAISQITLKATGFNIGGKIGIARVDNDIAVVVYFCIGMLNLNEIVLGLGHRVV